MTIIMDSKFQELARILDATLAEVNPEGLPNGQNAFRIIRFLREFPGMVDVLSPEFIKHIDQQLGYANVRREVKSIYTYPESGYAPWSIVLTETEKLSKANSIIEKKIFTPSIVKGKVYLISDNVVDELFQLFKHDSFVKNPENSHITLVNSDVVARIGEDVVKQYINDTKPIFKLSSGLVKSTYSRDWPVFSECRVLEVGSKELSEWIIKFNLHFKTSITPSTHITFAVIPRSLF